MTLDRTPLSQIPTPEEVANAQRQHGFDPMQAYYHCQGRRMLADRLERQRREALDAAWAQWKAQSEAQK